MRAGVACAIWARGFLEPDDQVNVVKKQNFRLRNTQHSEVTQMDTTTLLIIVLLILLLGGGGWYGRGRWY